MSDHDRTRPALPDPQRDRHVAFPDDPSGPEPSGRSGGRSTAAPSSLPPEAWAPRTADPAPTTPSTWQPPVAPVLLTPPTRAPQPPAKRWRPPGWLAFVLVPALLIGISNGQTDSSLDGECSYAVTGSSDLGCVESVGPDGDSMDGPMGVPGVWAEDSTATTTFGPFLGEGDAVSPVPASATALRVEVVTKPASPTTPFDARVDTTVNGSPIDAWDQGLPHATTVHLQSRPPELTVSVSVTTGRGTIQCRVYADEVLVAVDTSTSEATCTPTF